MQHARSARVRCLVEFRGHTARVQMEAGEMREVQLIGRPTERRARAAKLDVVRPEW